MRLVTTLVITNFVSTKNNKFMIEWRSITGFENYEINRLGEVRSIDRIEHNIYGTTSTHYQRHRSQCLLKPIVKDGMYVVYSFSKRDKLFQRYAHRLVAETFIGPIPKGKVVNHKDGNRLNNSVDNLEIVSQRDNVLHCKRKGKKSSQYPGVYFTQGKFVAMARVPGGNKKYLGRFITEEEAYQQYKNYVSSQNLQYV